MDLLKWVIGIFILFGVFWFIVGGTETTQRPFLRPPSPLNSGEQYGPTSDGVTISLPRGNNREDSTAEEGVTNEGVESISIFDGKVSFSRSSRASREDPDEEYVTIQASKNNLESINISNWSLKSALTGKEVSSLGTGAPLYYSGQVVGRGAIFLNPGESAIIVTGSSPIGISFKVNRCSGYLEQFQDFQPTLKKQCPLAIDENPPVGAGDLNDMCLDYLERIRRCEIVVSPPISIDSACRDFIAENVNYNSCVDNHRNDSDFTSSEWRVFLGRADALWKQRRETILLIDATGKTVDSLSY